MADLKLRVVAVVVAGGSGSRFSGDGPRKQYRMLNGQPILAWALRSFIDHPAVDAVIAVLPAADLKPPPEWLTMLPVRSVAGGVTRGESVRRGLEAIPVGTADTVLIHDGARPFVSASLLDRVLRMSGEVGVTPGLRVTDTLKEVDACGEVLATIDRERIWRVQTPQAFPLEAIREAHERARREGVTATDDAALFERYGLPVRVVDGDPENIKVTVPIDFQLAELLAIRLLTPPLDSSAGDLAAKTE